MSSDPVTENIEIVEGDDSIKDEAESFYPKSAKGFWDYEFRGYLPQKSVFAVAKADKKLIGSMGMMPYVLNVNGQSLLTGRLERGQLKTKFRGGTLFTQMINLCDSSAKAKGVNFLWGFTLAKKPLLREGFEFHEKYLEHALCCVSFSGALKCRFINNRILGSASNVMLAGLSLLVRNINRCNIFTNKDTDKVAILNELKDEDDINNLYHGMRRNTNMIFMEQDLSFQKWLLERSGRKYKKYFAYKSDELVAYMYIDLTEKDSGLAMIKDVASIDSRATKMIVDKASKDLKSEKIGFLHAVYNFKNPVMRSLSRKLYALGFIPLKRGGSFVIRTIKYKDNNIWSDIRPWYITPIWSDLYVG